MVDRRNLENIRQELNFQLSGDVSDETAQSIGKMYGAQAIISGEMTAIGDTYRMRVSAIAVETTQILGMINLDVVKDNRFAALTGTGLSGGTLSAVQNFITLPNVGWRINAGPGTTVKTNTNYERIDGQERDVLNLEVTLPQKGDSRFGQI